MSSIRDEAALRRASRVWALSLTAAAAGICWACPSVAEASAYYVETGAGITQFRNADPFFPNSPASSNLGIAANIGAFYSLSDGGNPIELHLGLQTRLNSVSQDSFSEETLSLYPIVRVQVTVLYLGLGATPILARRVEPSSGLSDFSSAHVSMSYLAEVGGLWSVTPDFSLGAAVTAQFTNAGGTMSPSPTVDAAGVMRFYFGYSSSGVDATGGTGMRGSDEWHGWRYPFGEIR